jgi:hypothetical protein
LKNVCTVVKRLIALPVLVLEGFKTSYRSAGYSCKVLKRLIALPVLVLDGWMGQCAHCKGNVSGLKNTPQKHIIKFLTEHLPTYK